MDREAQFPPPGPLIGPERRVMAGSYGKQQELDKQLTLKPLQDALILLQERTGVDFYEMYQKRYDLEPAKGQEKETVRDKVSDITDLKNYFDDGNEQSKRIYYRYIKGRFFPEIPAKKSKDYLIMEEELPNGKILAIFKYGVKPGKLSIEDGQEFEFRTLAGCYAITTDKETGQEMAVDLISFWTGAPSPSNIDKLKFGIRNSQNLFKVHQKYPTVNPQEMAKRAHFDSLTEENRLIRIGVINRNTSQITPPEQIELIKELGYFLFEDQAGSEKWMALFEAGAAFSQYEGDKSESHMRSDLPLGSIRMLLGESKGNENQLIEEFLTEANKRAGEQNISLRDIPIEQILQETRDWVRNRLAVSLYTIRKLHKMGIDFVPREQYGQLLKTIEEKLEQIGKTSSIGNQTLKLT